MSKKNLKKRAPAVYTVEATLIVWVTLMLLQTTVSALLFCHDRAAVYGAAQRFLTTYAHQEDRTAAAGQAEAAFLDEAAKTLLWIDADKVSFGEAHLRQYIRYSIGGEEREISARTRVQPLVLLRLLKGFTGGIDEPTDHP